jgi:hypothetical protein
MAQNPKTIDDFVSNKFREYLKTLLVFKGKGYSWKRELQNKFSIADEIVNDGLKILEKEGYLISKDFWSLDLDMQEVIRRMDGAYFSDIKRFPKIYMLTNDERFNGWWECNRSEIEFLIKGNNSILHTMNLVTEANKSVEKLQNKFLELEEHDYKRVRYDSDSGLYYETLTRKEAAKRKKLAQDVQEGILELKNTPKLSKEQKTQLSILEKKSTSLSVLTTHKDKKLKHILNGVGVDIETFRRKEAEIERFRKKDNQIGDLIEKEKDDLLKKELKNDEYRIKGQLNKVKVVEHVEGYGKSVEELNQEGNSLDSWEIFLGASDKKISEKDIVNELDKKIHELKYELLDKGFLDAHVARERFENDKEFIKFQESLKDYDVSFDGTDFLYKRSS